MLYFNSPTQYGINVNIVSIEYPSYGTFINNSSCTEKHLNHISE